MPIIKDEFEKLLEQREKQDLILDKQDSNKNEDNITYEVKEANSEDLNTLINKIAPIEKYVNEISLESDENNENNESNESDESDELIYCHFNSSKRTNIHSSRYNYRINLENVNIPFEKINTISKIIIPIEDNYIFSIPVFVLTIPELNTSLHMQQAEVIEGTNRNYGVYKPIQKHILKNSGTLKITIDIRDISEKKYSVYDILKVNIVELKNNRIYFTCSSIHKNDYKTGDYIKIINNNSHNNLFHIFQEPLKIKKIQDNILVCDYRGLEELDDRIYTNIDMKIMNMSNQNIIYFN